MNNEIKIRKVHIDTLIQVLMDLYDKGVDYVDILGTSDNKQDTIGLSFCKEYMDEELADNFSKIPVTSRKNDEININLSDENLNELL
jgi:hypothetical protein